MIRAIRLILYGALALLAIGLMTAGCLYLWLRTSLPDYQGSAELSGLGGPVTVIRDEYAVPHIFADSWHDALFALGYVHAQDRLWQMEMNRRIGHGRVAEIAGPAGLGLDKLVRTLGFAGLAQQIVPHLSDDARSALEAYAAGVNAFIANDRGALPPEFVATGTAPEPWTPADTILWGKLMTLQLSGNWFGERLRLSLSRRLDAENIADLWPDTHRQGPVTLTGLAPLYRANAELAGHSPLPAFAEARGFSNEWVVDGRQSATGRPLLANDPHLEYQAPNYWYLARIETPGLKIRGATVPGVPLVLLGQNDRIAWGMTTTGGDVADLFIERLDPATPDHYMTPDGSQPFGIRKERIRVKNGDDVELMVRTTRHGPVVSDLWADEVAEPDHVLALQAAFLRDDDRTAEAMLRVNHARDWSEFLSALRLYQAPQQNFVYADADGHIGFIAPGLIPVRRRGDGFMPVPGWTDDYAWTGFLPFDALPRAFDPPDGRIVNANNAVVPPDYPHFIARHWETRYRAARIEELLDRGGDFTVEKFIALQADTISTSARDLLPRLLAVAPSADATEAHRLLANWNYAMIGARTEPLIFTAWLRELNRALYEDELGPLFRSYWGLRPEVVSHLLNRPKWCDDRSTPAIETCEDRIALALDRAVADLTIRFGDDVTEWRWRRAHFAAFRHRLFEFVPLIRNLANLSESAEGGADTINRNMIDIRDETSPYAAVHGAGFRAVYDLSDPNKSRFVHAPGQSGNPLSPHYGDFLPAWRDFRYIILAGDRETLAKRALGVLTLKPAKGGERTK